MASLLRIEQLPVRADYAFRRNRGCSAAGESAFVSATPAIRGLQLYIASWLNQARRPLTTLLRRRPACATGSLLKRSGASAGRLGRARQRETFASGQSGRIGIRQRASLLWLRDLPLTAAQHCNLQEAGVCFP